MKALKDVLPDAFLSGEYDGTPAFRLKDVTVLEEHHDRWPGPHKNVAVWYVLVGGKAVAWNEHPSRGWSFPCITYNKVAS